MCSESQPRWGPAGNHIGFIGVAHDITAAKQAEADLRRLNETLEQRIEERSSQLRSNEAKMRAILETSNQYQGLLDLEGNVVYANATALAGIRATAQDVVGQPFWETPWWRGSREVQAKIRLATEQAATGKAFREELPYWMADGSERLVDFGIHPIRDRSGAVVFLH